MEILITLTFLTLFIVICGVFILLRALILKTRENIQIKKYIKLASDRINQARYGNFQIKINDKNDKLGLYKSLNSLFESIFDRDLVINEYREKEKENYNLKEEFIQMLTHDLKVPIIAQDKTCDLFLEEKFGKLTEIQKDVILRLKNSNSDLKKMVECMLETYKIENNGVELSVENNIDLNKFILNCISTFKEIENCYNKKIEFHPHIENLKADFDPFLIKRVILNLIMNSISHSTSSDKIDVHLNKTGDFFSIDIVDYGDGIDEEEIKKIFNKYYSLTSKTNKISGGLGLYLSNKIVKKHNGEIEVESKKGQGAIFRIILPIKILAQVK